MRGGIIFLLVCSWLNGNSQPLQADFTMPLQACLNEQLQIINRSVNASNFEWDFCQGDLDLNPSAFSLGTINGSVTTGIDIVFDGNEWFGFITNQNGNSITRLDFGSDFQSIPIVTNLGNISDNLNKPSDIKIIWDNGSWYGFVYSADGPNIARVDFGNSLRNTQAGLSPISSVPVVLGSGTVNGGFDMIYDGTKWIILLIKSPSYEIVKLSDIKAIPSASDIISSIANPFGTSLGDVTIINLKGKYYAYNVAYGTNKLLKLDFGTELFSSPLIEDITPYLPSGSTPYGIDSGIDSGQFYLFISTLQGNLLRVNLGEDLSQNNITGVDLGTFSILTNNIKLRLIKKESSWSIFSTDFNSSNLFKIDFPSPQECKSNAFSSEENPKLEVKYSGRRYISLKAYHDLNFSYKHQSVDVTNNFSPIINFSNANICSNSLTTFQYESDQNIFSSIWSFGDTQTSILPNPTHQYSTAGEYTVQLNVTATNGCKNFTEKVIKIYDPTTSSFDLPGGLICTNNEFAFVNNTIDNFDGLLTYEWLVNDVQKSTSRDFNYAFTSEGDQQVKLITAIPGCSDELTQTVMNVQTGPSVGFSVSGQCEDVVIAFTNESAGSISSYQWNFGNGNTSIVEHPTETYNDHGYYDVSLSTTGSNGCVSTLTKPVNVYSVPQTNYSLALPPFACSGSASQFSDVTPPMQDSNITSWTWSFGDVASGISSQKNPLYTYSLAGAYPVRLTTTTNFGCSNSIQKTVTIYPSPKSDFSFGPACVNQGTSFTDLSTGDLKSWLWSIQSSTYSVKNPVHIFKSASTHNALLTVTGTNNCISQISKNIHVPVPAVADFASSSTCATKSSVFQEINTAGADPAVSWQWDFGGQGSASTSPAQHIFSSTGNYPVRMNTTRQSGCTYSITKTIPITTPPKARFTVFLDAGAAPFPVNFVNTSLQSTAYNWKFGDPANTVSQEFSPSFTYRELGDYTAELIARNAVGCTDRYSQPIYVVVPQINAAISDFKINKVPGSNSWNSTVTIENKSNVALIDPDVYLDITGKALIKEKIIGVIKPNESLVYTFNASIAQPAMDFACAEIKIDSDVNFYDNRQCVNVTDQYISRVPYPNPASNSLTLEWINITSAPMDVYIYDASGQLITGRTYSPASTGLNQVLVDVSGLPVGIYFVSYSVEGQRQNFKFSIVR